MLVPSGAWGKSKGEIEAEAMDGDGDAKGDSWGQLKLLFVSGSRPCRWSSRGSTRGCQSRSLPAPAPASAQAQSTLSTPGSCCLCPEPTASLCPNT